MKIRIKRDFTDEHGDALPIFSSKHVFVITFTEDECLMRATFFNEDQSLIKLHATTR